MVSFSADDTGAGILGCGVTAGGVTIFDFEQVLALE
jgi:hypothetical protein